MKKLLVLFFAFTLSACSVFFSESLKPETAIESVAVAHVTFQETIKVATNYRAAQIEAGDNEALVAVDAGILTLMASDRINRMLSDARSDGGTLSIEQLNELSAMTDELLQAYYGAGGGTSLTADVTELFQDTSKWLSVATTAASLGDAAAVESNVGKALSALQALRGMLAADS